MVSHNSSISRIATLFVSVVMSAVMLCAAGVLAASPATAAQECPDVAVVMMPGTWETNSTANPNVPVGMLKQITDPIAAKFGPAVKMVFTNYAADAFRQMPYATSKQDGVAKASAQLASIYHQCSSIRFVLGGFSQGAHGMGDIASNIGNGRGPIPASAVLAVALLADPSQGTPGEIAVGPQPVGKGIAGPRPQGMGELSGKVATICAPGDLYCGISGQRDGLLSSLGQVLAKSGAPTAVTTGDASSSNGGTATATTSADTLAASLTSNLPSQGLGTLGDSAGSLTGAATPAPGTATINPTGIAQSATSLRNTLTPLASIAKDAATDPGLTQSLASAPAGSPEHAANGVLSAASKIDLPSVVNTVGQLAQTASSIGTTTLPAMSPQAQQLTSAAQGVSGQIAPLSSTPADALNTASTVLSTLSPQVLVDQVLNVGTGVSQLAANIPKMLADLQALPARIAALDANGTHQIAGDLNNLFAPLVKMAAKVDLKAAAKVVALIPDPYGYAQIASMVLGLLGNIDVIRLANDIGQAQEIAWAALKNPLALTGLIPVGLDIATVAAGMLSGTAQKTDPGTLGSATEVSGQAATVVNQAQGKDLAGLAGSLTGLAGSQGAQDLTTLVSQGLDAASFFASGTHVKYPTLTVDKHGRSATQWLSDWLIKAIAPAVQNG